MGHNSECLTQPKDFARKKQISRVTRPCATNTEEKLAMAVAGIETGASRLRALIPTWTLNCPLIKNKQYNSQ